MNLPSCFKLFLVTFLGIVLGLLLFLVKTPSPVYAIPICNGDCTGCTIDWQEVPFSMCEKKGLSKNNTCTGATGGSSECGSIPAWSFCYAAGCEARALTGSLCNQYRYRYTYNQCNAADRSEDFRASINNKEFTRPGSSGGAATGDTRYATMGHVLPGICNASYYDNSDPKSACISGGWYKTCCQTRNGVQTGVMLHSQNGVCQDYDSDPATGAVITAPGVTSCAPEAIPGPPPGPGGGGSCRWNDLGCGWSGWIGSCWGSASSCERIAWWDDGGDPTAPGCTPGGNICNGWGQKNWDLGCGQGNACAVTLLTPLNGSTGLDQTITFDWTDAGCWGYACARGSYTINYSERHYELLFREQGDTVWTTVVRLSGDDATSTNPPSEYTYTIPDFGAYEWQVKSFWEIPLSGQPAAQGSSFSPIWTFSTVTREGAWWQVKDADVQAGGNLSSVIPSSCTSPSCNPNFDLDGTGGYPGVCAHGGATAAFGSGVVSSKGWLANSAYAGGLYNYAYFSRLSPSKSQMTKIEDSDLDPDGALPGGYFVSNSATDKVNWFYREGDLIIKGTANMNVKRAVILIEGNLYLGTGGRNVNLRVKDGTGFLGFFVRGNILISPETRDDDPGDSEPWALEAILLSDGTITTGTFGAGTADYQLPARGVWAAWSAIALQRDLDPTKASGANNTKPSEFIEYAPDLIFTFPRELARRGIIWREVAP